MAIDRCLVGRRIRDFREMAGLTRMQLVRLMGGRNHQPLLLIENGRRTPSLGHLERLAEACNSSMHEFLGDTFKSPEEFMLGDDFIAEIAPLVKNISPKDRKVLFEVLQELQWKDKHKNNKSGLPKNPRYRNELPKKRPVPYHPEIHKTPTRSAKAILARSNARKPSGSL